MPSSTDAAMEKAVIRFIGGWSQGRCFKRTERKGSVGTSYDPWGLTGIGRRHMEREKKIKSQFRCFHEVGELVWLGVIQ